MVGLPTAKMHFSRQSELAQNNVKRRHSKQQKEQGKKNVQDHFMRIMKTFLITFDLQEVLTHKGNFNEKTKLQ